MTLVSLLLTLVAVFVAVSLLAGVLTSWVLTTSSTDLRRLRAATRAPDAIQLPEVRMLSTEAPHDGWERAAKLLGRSPKAANRLRLRLIRAGFDQPGAVVTFTLLQMLLPLAAAGVVLVFMRGQWGWIAAAGVAIVAFLIPGFVVEARLSARRREIENGLPDALDLFVVCIEAGCGLDQAIMKTSDELAVAYPTLANELRILNSEIRAGKPRIEAFQSLAQRTKVDDVRALVAMLVQTDRFGTSIGQALRTHADVSRGKRRQRAEERAQKVGVKLVFPLVFCFFPAFYVVILGPAIIQFVRAFMK